MTSKTTQAVPIVGTALLLALVALASPAAAEPQVRVWVHFNGEHYEVKPPQGWACNVEETVDAGETHYVHVECFDFTVAYIPLCGTVTAGVTGQTGGAGATVAIAICSESGQAQCIGTYDPVRGARDCSISVSGSGVAACEFITAGVGYTTDSWCDFPVL